MKNHAIAKFSVVLVFAAGVILNSGCFSETSSSTENAVPTTPRAAEVAKPASTEQLPPTNLVRRTVKLPSGNEVKILDVGKLTFSKGDPAVIVKYQTALKIDDQQALRNEAEEVWQNFKAEVEKQGFKNAVVSANETTEDVLGTVVTRNQGYNFIFKRTDDGAWILKN